MEEKNEKFINVPFNTNPESETRFESHWTLFLKYKEIKEQPVSFLSKEGVPRNIIDYIKDSIKRMNENHPKPDWKEDWQQNVFDPITRNKLIAILSTLAAARMKPELIVKPLSIFKTSGIKERQRVYQDLLDSANIKNQDANQLIWEMYTGLSEGTVFGYEGWKKDTRNVEYVIDYDPDTGKKKTQKIKYDAWDDVYGEIVPIQELYPETIWTKDWKNIHRLFWAKEMTLAGFKDTYGKFKNASLVKPAMFYSQENGDLPFGISQDIDPENILVLHFYDEIKDKYGIWANGVEIYYGCLPWNHKRKPFWHSISEPIHHQFLFGKSLPDKLMGMQDVNNSILNGMLDQLFISLNSPIFIDGMMDIEEGYLQPGRIITGDPGAKAQKLSIGGVDQTAFAMLQLIKRSMEESSVSAQAQGIPTGGRKTKFEVEQLQEGALKIASLALQLMENSMRQKYLLRMYNILQYYSQPSNTKSGKEKFKFIKIDNTTLTNNKKGTKLIQIVGSKKDVPSKEELINIAEKEEGEPFDVLESRVEPIVITSDYLMNKDFELEINIVPNASVKETLTSQKNKALAFYQATKGDPGFDQDYLNELFAEAMDQPKSVIKKGGGTPEEIPGLPGMPGMKGQPSPQKNTQANLDIL